MSKTKIKNIGNQNLNENKIDLKTVGLKNGKTISNGVQLSRKLRYEVWFIILEGEAWRRIGKKKIRADTEAVNSSKNKTHLIDTTSPFNFKNKRIFFVDIMNSTQAYITSHEHLTDEKGNPIVRLDPERQDLYTEKKTIKNIVTGMMGRFEMNWRDILVGLVAGIGLGWILYQILTSYGVI